MDHISYKYDYIFIDCLPSLAYLNLAALNASDFILIPTKPSPFSTAGLKDLFDNIDKVKRRMNKDLDILGIVLNLVEGKSTKTADEIEEVLRDSYSQYMFNATIRKGIKLEESPSLNMSIMEYDPKGKDASQFKVFLDEFMRRIEKYNDQETKF